MSNDDTMIISDAERVEWLRRHGGAALSDAGTVPIQEQIDAQIRKARMENAQEASGDPGSSDKTDALVPTTEATARGAANLRVALDLGELR